ncbi:unnamed protein product [Arabidopsis thaliana]|uniref:Uncharacterized protein n=2 Tax=Arabidopsis thaliana TaxID=3702 RepID=A0A1I9LPG2_ARATH|nr:uncharacterized protein AT3G44769 [Arabidopsis thaliana]ANM64470.1 hypothetical protein AT3G44769 [Arabidopsis thaliana]VYS59358.1 unnamed protein product [Arabidopsis thaliana]|eukprot:NP_001326495.1 hypothetical protein AT3G44769 [Arabidopsis thaliana]
MRSQVKWLGLFWFLKLSRNTQLHELQIHAIT